MAGKYSCLIYLILYMGSFVEFSKCANKQNNPPQWIDYLKQTLQIDGIYEDTPVGSVLGYLKAKDLEGDPIKYECQSQTVECTSDGKVTLVRVLDRELSIKNPTLQTTLLTTKFIAVEVNNKQDPSKNVKTITIFVKDVNDNVPQFMNVPYKASVDESAALDSTVFKGVSVEDIDSGVNAEVTLSCYEKNAEDPEACQYFSIETVRDTSKVEGKYNGYIVLKKPIDYEKRTSYVMTILASDKGSNVLSSSVNVLILVNDIQDKPPFFQQSPYTIFLSENTPVNKEVTKLKAQDGDTGNPNPVRIEITYDQGRYFQIGPTVPENGITYAANLFLKKPLDRETLGNRYSFNISVTELQNGVPDPSAKSYSFVNVEILDENDDAPHFLKDQYQMTFAEFVNANNAGILVGNPIVAVDKDSTSNAIFTIEVTNQTIPGVFGVSPTSGIKSTVVSLIALKPYYLDYDNIKYRQQTVVITARQTNSTKKLSSSTTVFITLTDQNDNAPVFKKSLYRARIPEDTKIGTTILKLQATDKDSGRNKEIVYQINGYGSEYFSVDKTGNVILQRDLDFEFLNTFNLLAFARDGGEQSLISSVDIIISVTDVNDNGPIFNPKSYSTNVLELSTKLEPSIHIQATDKDAGTKIQYAIESGNTIDNAFMIDPNTGHITLKRGIKIKDIKDNSGTIFLKVKATDNGNPPRSSFVTVNINILDINDHKPIFAEQVYKKSLKEFTPRGTYVLTVNATDADQGVNAELEYSIEDGNFDAFRIEPKTGKIYVASEAVLDYDVHDQYNMKVKAEDQGVPRLSSTTSVIIKLIDINNKKPKFDKSEYFVTINENIAPQSSIQTVSATDNDVDSQLVYSIDRRSIMARKADGEKLPLSTLDYSNAFTINSQTGEIKTNMKFSLSLFPTISFEVLATDLKAANTNSQIARVRVVVIIHTSKRKLPYFIPEDMGQSKKIYKFTLPEDKQGGLRITRLQAIDPITGKMVTNYRLLSDDTEIKGIFDITNEGYVYLKKTLDFESMTTNLVTFDILAIASPDRTTTAEMQVTVVDVNDNSPKFEKNSYEFNISEAVRYPYPVGYVRATDDDSGSYSQISYSIEGLGHENFRILQSGEIIVNKKTKLDYESNQGYLLQVTATDNPYGDTHRKTLVKLTINVLDFNDNKPAFMSSSYKFYATENTDYGDSIGTVSAKDIDSGLNSRLEYSLSQIYTDNGQPIFRMERNTGQIHTVTKLLNVAERSPITFTVFANDLGDPQQTGQATVTVFISTSDVLDIPRIMKPRQGENATVPENKPINSIIFTMFAKARVDSNIVYSIDEPENSEIPKIFAINPDTGAITLKRALDYEKSTSYYISLKATDKGNATLYSTQRLRILVSDVDDNVPSFKSCDTYKKQISVSIPENYASNNYVVKVTACDKDSKPFNSMWYIWENATGCANAEANFNAFKLISSSGLIQTAKILNYEDVKEYPLCVRVIQVTNKYAVTLNQAQQSHNESVNDDGQVQKILVKVRDSNDNGPVFPNQEMFAVINEKAILGSEVVMVTAFDADNFPNNIVKYSIINTVYHPSNSKETYSAQTAFKVKGETGVITTNLPSYTEFVRGDFVVTLRAEDASNLQFFDTTNVKIYIIQPRQRSRIVLPYSPKESKKKTNDLMKKLNELNAGHFRIQEIHYHQGLNGLEVYDKTDVCLIIEDNGHIYTLSENQNLLESSKVQKLLKEFDAGTEGSCNPETSISTASWSTLWWVLVVFAIFMFVCAVILIIAICLLYKSHKKFMESERTSLIKN